MEERSTEAGFKEEWLKGERGSMLVPSSDPVTMKYAAV